MIFRGVSSKLFVIGGGEIGELGGRTEGFVDIVREEPWSLNFVQFPRVCPPGYKNRCWKGLWLELVKMLAGGVELREKGLGCYQGWDCWDRGHSY